MTVSLTLYGLVAPSIGLVALTAVITPITAVAINRLAARLGGRWTRWRWHRERDHRWAELQKELADTRDE